MKRGKKVWRIGRLLTRAVYDLHGNGYYTRKGTCLADCFALIAERKRGNHIEITKRYYNGWMNSDGGRSPQTVYGGVRQLVAYFRNRGFHVMQSDKRGPGGNRYHIVIGPCKDGSGHHAIIARGKKVAIDASSLSGDANIQYAEEHLWLQRIPRKRSRDHHNTHQRHR